MKSTVFALALFLLTPGYMAKNANRILTEGKFATHQGGDDRVTDAQPGFKLDKVAELQDGETDLEEVQQRVCHKQEWPLLCPNKSLCCDTFSPWCCPTFCCARGFPYCGKDGRCYADP